MVTTRASPDEMPEHRDAPAACPMQSPRFRDKGGREQSALDDLAQTFLHKAANGPSIHCCIGNSKPRFGRS